MNNTRLQKVIKNDWLCEAGQPFVRAQILNHEIHPEGLDVERLRFLADGCFAPKTGAVISILQGHGKLYLNGVGNQPLQLSTGVHLYLPPKLESFFEFKAGSELLIVSCPTDSQAHGKQLILRDEEFVAACASGTQSLRWILTPQYLSRRIFLRHDPILLSKKGNPVAWFRTTMFDVNGLPKNEDGEPVFKMSYNSRTEFNVCYDVKGTARVRIARHPYQCSKQLWEPWHMLDSDSTYHLNEAAGCPEEEQRFEEGISEPQYLRNKHEVYILDGYVTLFCMFDPSPLGIERHRPGEYSDYESVSQVLGSKSCENYQREMARYDEMVDRLSMAKAMGQLEMLHGTPIWELYLNGRTAQIAIESELEKTLMAEGKGRERIVRSWMQYPANDALPPELLASRD
jgi:hypothetical protein